MPYLLPVSLRASCLVALTFSVNDRVAGQIDYEEDDVEASPSSILAGWYDLSRFLVNLLVMKPKNADIVSALVTTNALHVDFIDLMDRFWSQQPSVFVFILMSIGYMTALAVGTPLYFWARSRNMMGGDRTQDINEGYKFVLQALTIAFIICIPVVGLTLVITAFTVYLQVPLVTGERKGLFADLKSVGTYARVLGEALRNMTGSQMNALQRVHNATQPSRLVHAVYEFLLPQVESWTSYMKIDPALKLHLLAQLAQKHSRVSGMLRVVDDLKPALQKNVTLFIASNFVQEYNSEITAALTEVPKALAYIARTAKYIDNDLETFLRSQQLFMNRLNDDSRVSLTAIFGHRFLYYGSASVIVCAVLVLLFSASFMTGVASHDDTVPPTKRSVVSERSGDGLLLCIAMNAAFGFFVVLFTTLVMLVGIMADGYLCGPYNDLVRSQIPDSASALVLDDVWGTFWNRKERGKYFGNLVPGYWLLNCDNDKRFIDLLPASLSKKMGTMHSLSTAFTVALGKIQVSLDKVLPVKGPDSMNPVHYEHLRSWLLDTTQISVLWANGLKNMVTVELPEEDSEDVDCMELFNVYDEAFSSFCDLTLKNHNGWWLAMYICMAVLGAMSLMSHYATHYFLVMVNYTYDGSEVESTSTEDTTTGKGSGDKSSSSRSDINAAAGKKQSRQEAESSKDQKTSGTVSASDEGNAAQSGDKDYKKDEEKRKKNNEEKTSDPDCKKGTESTEKGKTSTVAAE